MGNTNTELISSPGVVNIFHHHEFPVRERGSIGNYICLRKRKKLQESLVFFFSATFNPSWLHFRSLLAGGSRTIILPQLHHRRKRFQRTVGRSECLLNLPFSRDKLFALEKKPRKLSEQHCYGSPTRAIASGQGRNNNIRNNKVSSEFF